MDTLTQIVLGAGVCVAVLGRRLGPRRAAIAGGLLGTLPDLDVLIPAGDPVETFVSHRGFSHSLIIQAMVTPVIGEGHVFIFLEPSSPRTRDLEGNPDFCLHCAMSDSSGSSGEFQTTGIAVKVHDKKTRDLAESISNFRPSVRSLLFELYITDALSTAYRNGQPKRRRWQLTSAMAESN